MRWGEFHLGQVITGRGAYAAGEELIDFRTGFGNISPAYTPSACVVEVEVDPETGHVTVTGIWGADDSGFPLNPLAVKGQVMGATVMSYRPSALRESDPHRGQGDESFVARL